MDSKEKQTAILLNEEEKQLIKEGAKLSGLSTASFIRHSSILKARDLKFSVEKKNNPLYLEQQTTYDNKLTHQEEVH